MIKGDIRFKVGDVLVYPYPEDEPSKSQVVTILGIGNCHDGDMYNVTNAISHGFKHAAVFTATENIFYTSRHRADGIELWRDGEKL